MSEIVRYKRAACWESEARSRLAEIAAGHKFKHKACSSVAMRWPVLSRVTSPQNVYLGLLEDSSQAQADTRPLQHNADKLD